MPPDLESEYRSGEIGFFRQQEKAYFNALERNRRGRGFRDIVKIKGAIWRAMGQENRQAMCICEDDPTRFPRGDEIIECQFRFFECPQGGKFHRQCVQHLLDPEEHGGYWACPVCSWGRRFIFYSILEYYTYNPKCRPEEYTEQLVDFVGQWQGTAKQIVADTSNFRNFMGEHEKQVLHKLWGNGGNSAMLAWLASDSC
jgi:hypothetical protein